MVLPSEAEGYLEMGVRFRAKVVSPRDLGAVEDVIMMDAESKDGDDRVKSRGHERSDNFECGGAQGVAAGRVGSH